MIIAPMENIAQILIVLVLVTAAIIIMKRDIRSLIKTYAFQSLLLAVMALLFFVETGSTTLLFLAIIILVSKVWIIPHFMGKVQQKLNIKRDVQFHFLSPITALIIKPIHHTIRLPLIYTANFRVKPLRLQPIFLGRNSRVSQSSLWV